MSANAIYDTIGQGYTRQRRPDPRIAAQLMAALGDVRSVLNVGAGAGSYEPPARSPNPSPNQSPIRPPDHHPDRFVIAVEPSSVMLAQRPPSAAPAVQARAEALPFADGAFDAVMAVLTLHHWTDRARGLAECARVARQRVVLLTWDPAAAAFWLLQDYLPAFVEIDRRQFPLMSAYTEMFGDASRQSSGLGARDARGARVEIAPVPVPRDCVDGFFGAYWARPEAYLDPAVRAGISSFAHASVEPALERLRADLASGAWHARHGHLLAADALDLGYRLVVAHLPNGAA